MSVPVPEAAKAKKRPYDQKISIEHLINSLKEVTDWETLGIGLGLTTTKVEEIARKHREPHVCKKDILDHWLRNDAEPSWEKVAMALVEMDRRDVARKIREVYCNH